MKVFFFPLFGFACVVRLSKVACISLSASYGLVVPKNVRKTSAGAVSGSNVKKPPLVPPLLSGIPNLSASSPNRS